MLSVTTSPAALLAASDLAHAYSKDGRKICVGDCALFKPPQDSPPFIGLILRKEKNRRLSVNWLYRPADIKLGKGTLLEAAPNEVFYSFHRDAIPAASLLHPCKVAFLRKDVELPSGKSSFVCRRVYDVENKCLWWLTDKDYINERQEEVNQLIDKTRQEMHGAVQSGGRSPMPLNGSESVQNIASPLPSQDKGKKRDRGEQGSDPVKRERFSRADGTDSGQFRLEHTLRSEISKITDKGGLVDIQGVEKFVQLMQAGTAEKKLDLACRIMLVDVIAFTDSFDCLGWFLQLRGLPVLDEWLQEVHKGKIGDGSSPKESDKSVEEFLFVLLRALDKLPVNLHALQTCNIGKSVNHLRSHKNSEIQKKAKILVDTWKKRVEAEMNVIDANSGLGHAGSWPSKSVLSEISHVVSRRNGGSSGAAQSSACKTPIVKLGSGEAAAKMASASTDSTKLATSATSSGGASRKDLNSTTLVGGGSSDLPLSTIKEEKSCSSSQSQNNSQSSTSERAKTGGSCREDARRSTAGSVSGSKISGGVSRHRKSHNVHGFQKETSSLSRNMASEKLSPTRGTNERIPDGPHADHGNSQRLIVRLSNTGRSSALSANGGSFEDPTSTSIKASPSAHSEKLDHLDRKVKGKSDASRASGASNINMEGNAPSPGAPCSEQSRNSEDGEKLMEVSKGTVSPSGLTTKSGKPYDSSFSPMNALIESCAKFSEASPTALGGDDIGMNLLASVAAGEVSRSDVSPSGSHGRKSLEPEDSCSENNVTSRHLDDNTAQSEDRPDGGANDGAMPEQGRSVDCLLGKNESQYDTMPLSTNFSGDGKTTSFCCEEKTGECSGQWNSSSVDLQKNAHRLKSDGKPGQVNDASVVLSSEQDAKTEDDIESEGADKLDVRRKSLAVRLRIKRLSNSKIKARSPFSDEDKVVDYANEKVTEGVVVKFPEAAACAKVEKEANVASSPSCSYSEMGGEEKSALCRESDCGSLAEQKPSITANIHLQSMHGKNEGSALPSASVDLVCMEMKAEKSSETKAVSQTGQSEKQNNELSTSTLDQNEERVEEKKEIKEVNGHCPDETTSHDEPSTIPVQRTEQWMKSSVGNLDGDSNANTSSGPAAGPDAAIKLDFDLNEGFPVDDGDQVELAKASVPGNSSTVYPSPLPFPVSSVSASFPASVTVASAAKGPFFPPENLLRSKGELGWRGSAATSAFRPAEPRKVLDMPLSTSDSPPIGNTMSKQGRPPLDFDLNVPDQRVLEDERVCDRHGGGLDLDLNAVDGCPDVGQFSVSNCCKLEIPQLSSRSSVSGVFSNAGLSTSRDFDLNNGPGPDEQPTEATPHAKGNVPFHSPIPGGRMNFSDQGNFSSWVPPYNSYSAIAIPSILPGRGEQSYPVVPATGSPRILGPPTGGTTFAPEFYRGPVLQSSPAVPFSPAAPFQYAGFPFETNFPLSSSNLFSCGSTAYDSSSGRPLFFSSLPSQMVGPSAVVSSNYPRPYVMNLPSGTSNVGPETRKWGGQALDLNMGPVGTDVERRDERLSSSLRQLPIIGSQASADEQMRTYQMAVSKRKEPDGGQDGDRISYKQQHSWQ